MKLFDSIKIRRPRLNKFDLSYEVKTTMQMGKCVPIMLKEVLPGDKFRLNTEVMARMIPMLAPVMHRVNVFVHNFFVPTRLVWDEWEDFITGGRLGTAAPVSPYALASVLSNQGDMVSEIGLCNYFGLPLTTAASGDPAADVRISMLPFRAYQLIWDEYYRDQNLTASLDISKASGIIGAGAELDKLLTLRGRAWEKDYLTSALPFAQRGAPVTMPLDGTGSVTYKDVSNVYSDVVGYDPDIASTVVGKAATGPDTELALVQSGTPYSGRVENIDEVILDSSSVTINDLRRSIRLQEWLEKNARGGARYIEQILSHFGIISSDSRLQRPEYLGGGKTPMKISEVLSTVQQVDEVGDPIGNPQGDMSGHGFSVGNQFGFKRSFEEHGYVISIMSVLPKTGYMQGIDRMWTRNDKLDYYWPEFANIGEQAVLNREAYFDGQPAVPGTYEPNETFGYQSRYAEYKYSNSVVNGEFKSSLAYWHMARIFDSAPALNEAFVTSDPTTRIFANELTNAPILCYIFNDLQALRPMPYFGTPTL